MACKYSLKTISRLCINVAAFNPILIPSYSNSIIYKYPSTFKLDSDMIEEIIDGYVERKTFLVDDGANDSFLFHMYTDKYGKEKFLDKNEIATYIYDKYEYNGKINVNIFGDVILTSSKITNTVMLPKITGAYISSEYVGKCVFA